MTQNEKRLKSSSRFFQLVLPQATRLRLWRRGEVNEEEDDDDVDGAEDGRRSHRWRHERRLRRQWRRPRHRDRHQVRGRRDVVRVKHATKVEIEQRNIKWRKDTWLTHLRLQGEENVPQNGIRWVRDSGTSVLLTHLDLGMWRKIALWPWRSTVTLRLIISYGDVLKCVQ